MKYSTEHSNLRYGAVLYGQCHCPSSLEAAFITLPREGARGRAGEVARGQDGEDEEREEGREGGAPINNFYLPAWEVASPSLWLSPSVRVPRPLKGHPAVAFNLSKPLPDVKILHILVRLVHIVFQIHPARLVRICLLCYATRGDKRSGAEGLKMRHSDEGSGFLLSANHV